MLMRATFEKNDISTMAHLQRPPRMDPNGRAFFHFQSRRSRLFVQQRFTQQFKFTLQSRCLIEFLDDALLLSSVVSKVVQFYKKKKKLLERSRDDLLESLAFSAQNGKLSVKLLDANGLLLQLPFCILQLSDSFIPLNLLIG